MASKRELWAAAMRADEDFSAELKRQFGKRAGDMRYRGSKEFDARTVAAMHRFLDATTRAQYPDADMSVNPLLMTMGNPVRKNIDFAGERAQVVKVIKGGKHNAVVGSLWVLVAVFGNEARLTTGNGGTVHVPVDCLRIVTDARTLRAFWNKVERESDDVSENPGGRLMGTDVLAVVYRHKQDGKLYCHGFGDADIKLTTRGDALTITALKEWTGVRMHALPDGSVSISKPNGRVWEDM